MIFFKNLFLLLSLSLSLFSTEGAISSQEIISTDSPEDLIDNEVHTYESFDTENLNDIEEQMQTILEQTTVESVNSQVPVEEVTPISEEQTAPPPPKIEEPLKKTFSEAVAQAKKEHKIILLEIYGTGCHFCTKMENEVFPKERVVNELKDNFILLKINGDEEEIPLHIEKQMTPMHVFVTETEDIKDMTFGFLNEKDFLELLEREKN